MNTLVERGYIVKPADNGGFMVLAPANNGQTFGAFTDAEDLIKWLAESHQAEVVVMDQTQVAQMIGRAFTQGQASEATKQ